MKYIDAEKLKAAIEKGTPDELEFRAYRDFILYLIDDLQQEQQEEPDKDLEKEISTWIPAHISGGDDEVKNTKSAVIEWAGIVARHFAQWGAEHAKKDKTPVTDKSLEEVADQKYPVKDGIIRSEDRYDVNADRRNAFIAGAKWDREQMMDEWLKDRDGCFWDGVEEGKKAMEEQMMKAAVEGQVLGATDIKALYEGKVYVVSNLVQDTDYNLHPNDKVRIIVLPKEDDK